MIGLCSDSISASYKLCVLGQEDTLSVWLHVSAPVELTGLCEDEMK